MSAALSEDPRGGADLVGTVHYFGEDGPAYEVLAVEGNTSVLVRVVETGETVSYPIENVRNDPDA